MWKFLFLLPGWGCAIFKWVRVVQNPEDLQRLVLAVFFTLVLVETSLFALVVGLIQNVFKLITIVRTQQNEFKQHVTDQCANLGEEISEKHSQLKVDVAVLRANSEFLMQSCESAPIQQSQFLAQISSLYALHDRDQQCLSEKEKEIVHLKKQNAELKSEVRSLRSKLEYARNRHREDDYELEL